MKRLDISCCYVANDILQTEEPSCKARVVFQESPLAEKKITRNDHFYFLPFTFYLYLSPAPFPASQFAGSRCTFAAAELNVQLSHADQSSNSLNMPFELLPCVALPALALVKTFAPSFLPRLYPVMFHPQHVWGGSVTPQRIVTGNVSGVRLHVRICMQYTSLNACLCFCMTPCLCTFVQAVVCVCV